jgi:hypothetical protein
MLHVGAETLAGADGSLAMDDQELSERPIIGLLVRLGDAALTSRWAASEQAAARRSPRRT